MNAYDAMMTGLHDAIQRSATEDRLQRLFEALDEKIKAKDDCTDALRAIDDCISTVCVEHFDAGVRAGMQIMAKIMLDHR